MVGLYCLILEPGPESGYLVLVLLPLEQIIYTPAWAFARMARDTVMRRANRRAGEMGDNKHEEAHS